MSAAEKRDYEEVFIVCQVSIARSASLSCQTFLKILPSFSSYRNIRVNPKFSATAKPETITQLLQIMQPASA
ncbi:hypothetical protein, partial [Achromobacter denitrificans]|uniref:hypothetical protein n=1 Tax=Achromobacter denitrificans TaxID=32002 RepID=UPI001C3DDD8F